MKILILLILAVAIAMPERDININVAPRRVNVAPKRDTTDERLTYDFDDDRVTVKYIDFCGLVKQNRKVYARINEMNLDGSFRRTLISVEIDARRKLQATIPWKGVFKIAVFAEGDYCNGIEFDFRFFGSRDMTPIHQFVHHSILCQ